MDNIDHPSHYCNGTRETIETIKDITGEGFNDYCVGNVIKYISRYKYKGEAEDIKKAIKYLEFLLKDLETKTIQK